MSKDELITKLNNQIAEIDIGSIEEHIKNNDLADWVGHWRIETAAICLGLFVRLNEAEKNKGFVCPICGTRTSPRVDGKGGKICFDCVNRMRRME